METGEAKVAGICGAESPRGGSLLEEAVPSSLPEYQAVHIQGAGPQEAREPAPEPTQGWEMFQFTPTATKRLLRPWSHQERPQKAISKNRAKHYWPQSKSSLTILTKLQNKLPKDQMIPQDINCLPQENSVFFKGGKQNPGTWHRFKVLNNGKTNKQTKPVNLEFYGQQNFPSMKKAKWRHFRQTKAKRLCP